MDVKKAIEAHKLPCGPMMIAIDGTCRRRLRDHFDALLDRLTQETHPAGVDEEIMEVDQVEIPEEPEPEETDEEKKKRLIAEGKLKIDVKKAVKSYEDKVMGNSKMLQNQSGKIKKR